MRKVTSLNPANLSLPLGRLFAEVVQGAQALFVATLWLMNKRESPISMKIGEGTGSGDGVTGRVNAAGRSAKLAARRR